MKRQINLALSTCALATIVTSMSGCQRGSREVGTERTAVLNAALVDALQRTSIENAIIRQQAMYPYHFVVGSASLNQLGLRDLLVLAGHYQDNPGELYVSAGDASDELYAGRLQSIHELFAQQGIEPGRVQLSADAMPGGSGVGSGRLIEILSAEADVPAATMPTMPNPLTR